MALEVRCDGGFGESIFSNALEERKWKRQRLAPGEQIAVQVQEIAKKDSFSALLKLDSMMYPQVIKPFFELRDRCNLMGVSRAFLEVEENQEFQVARRINLFSLSILRRYRNISQLGERRWEQIQSYFPEAQAFSCNGLIKERAQITDDEVVALVKHFPQLTDIYLTFCSKITSKSVLAIAKRCRNLKVIELSGCSITDVALEAIAKYCKDLKLIDLAHCQSITNAGVEKVVASCKNLKDITVYGCHSTIQNAIQLLRDNGF